MKLPLSVLLLGFGLSESAFAFSPEFHLGLEADVSRNTVTPATFPFYRAGMSAKDTNYDIDFELKMSLQQAKANAFSAKNIFYDVQDGESSLHFSFGRKWINWSELDESWGLGQFNVLDSWDRLRSSSQGLSGLFMNVESESFHFDFFGSYLMLPEITPNIVIENQSFKLYHPQAPSAGPKTHIIYQRATRVIYNLNIPSLSKILLRPSVAFGISTKKNFEPFYGKLSFGYLPLNYFPIALYGNLDISLDQITLDLNPRLLSHNVYNAEVRYLFNEETVAGLGILVDQIFSENSLPSTYTSAPLGTTNYWSPWLKWKQFKLSHIFSQGGISGDVNGLFGNSGQNILSSRILYRNATQLQLSIDEITAKFLHEFSIKANWVALDWKHNWTNQLSSIVGGDIISAEKDVANGGGAEFLSDLRALDRIRVGVNYVF